MARKCNQISGGVVNKIKIKSGMFVKIPLKAGHAKRSFTRRGDSWTMRYHTSPYTEKLRGERHAQELLNAFIKQGAYVYNVKGTVILKGKNLWLEK